MIAVPDDGDDYTFRTPNAAFASEFTQDADSLRGTLASAANVPEDARREWVQRFRQCLRTGETLTVEYAGAPEFGPRWFLARIAPVHQDGSDADTVCLVATEITARKSLEAQLARSQRLEAIGRLAGGVAHDFNNLLTVILSHARFIERDSLDAQARSDAGAVREAGERASSLTRRLLAFARRQVSEPQTLDLNALTHDTRQMLERLIGTNITIVTRLAGGIWTVRADPAQVEQVLMNLVVNARDAMPDGGRLTIETLNVHLDEAYAVEAGELQPGDFVMLSVSDTGTGVDPSVLPHLFEPFFTTKPLGKGTGLGLPMCFGIMKQAGGHIAVYSEPGHGTTVKCYFPRTDGSIARRPQVAPLPAPGGNETVLLVEDEASVRELAARSLGAAGYRVLACSDGEEALRVAAGIEGAIALLVTDVVMPNMGGPQLASALQETRPETRVLYTSGYTENAIVHGGTLPTGFAYLAKPYLPETLLLRVRQVLDGG